MIFVVMRCSQVWAVTETLRASRVKNIVFVGNNVRATEIASFLPEKNVMFAFSLSAGHRERDRVVSIDLKKITIVSFPARRRTSGLSAKYSPV